MSEHKLLLKSNNYLYSIKKDSETLHETKMTSNTTPSPFVTSSSSIYNTSYPAWKAFDGNTTTLDTGWSTTSNDRNTGWIQIDYGTIKKVNTLHLFARNYTSSSDISSSMLKDFKILGSNDGFVFDELTLITNQTNWGVGEERIYSLNDTFQYRIYRVQIISNNGFTSYSSIGEILFSYVESLTQIPSDSVDNFLKYGMINVTDLNMKLENKSYILTKEDNSDGNGLLVQEINRKPLSIKI